MLSLRRFIANRLCGLLPPTGAYGLKRTIWRWAGVRLGRGARLVSSVRIWTSGPVLIGEDTFIGHEVLLVGGDAPISIGARCDLAPRVTVSTGTHEEGDLSRAAGPGLSKPVTVEDGVWIGTNVTLIAGSSVGAGSIVAAGSLVNKDVPAGVVAGGVPCRVLRSRVPNAPSHSEVAPTAPAPGRP